jgi:hypothetical protein
MLCADEALQPPNVTDTLPVDEAGLNEAIRSAEGLLGTKQNPGLPRLFIPLADRLQKSCHLVPTHATQSRQ